MQGVGRVGAKRRVLLKLSGEALMGDSAYGIDPAVAVSIASQIHDAQRSPIISGSDDGCGRGRPSSAGHAGNAGPHTVGHAGQHQRGALLHG